MVSGPQADAKILVVDDDAGIVRLFVRALTAAGYTHVRGVTDAGEVPSWLDTETPDLVVLDLNMPGMDGFTLLREITGRLAEDAFLPVMAVSGMSGEEAKERAFSSGAKDFLAKPVDLQEFLLHVNSLLETRFLSLRLLETQDRLAELVGMRTEALRRSLARSREVKQALYLSKEQIRLLSEDSGVAVGFYAPDGTVLFVSEMVGEVFGFDPEKAVGRHLTTLMPAEQAALVLERIRRVCATGHRTQFEGEVARASGETAWFLSTYSRVVDGSGQVRGVQVVSVDITEKRRALDDLQQAYTRLRSAQSSTLQALAFATELRDPYTAGHQRNVARLAMRIAQVMGLPAHRLEVVRIAATVHDVGKIAVPLEILSSPSPLTPVQRSIIQEHVQSGFEILSPIAFERPVAEIVRQHHERLDGSGYPRGLKGEEILLEARILAVADTAEAMVSHRPYRPALGIGPALEELKGNSDRLYDAAVVEALTRIGPEEIIAEGESDPNQLDLLSCGGMEP